MTFDHEAYERCFHSNDQSAAAIDQHVDAQTSEAAVDEKAAEPAIEIAGDPVEPDAADLVEGGETDGA